jgi:hypothetical protein
MKPRPLLPILLLVPTVTFVLNYALFQRPVEQVLQRDDRNAGMVVRAHWRWYVDPTVLVYDLQGAAPDTRAIDVLRALLQFAYRQKDRRFSRVVLAWKGTPRFYLAGADFAELGRTYPTRSPIDTMAVIPPMVRRVDGNRAFPGRGNQPFFALQEQRLLDFNRFVNEWAGF